MSITPLPDALETCAREPIHIPGAIQPHGALIAFTLPDFRPTHWSANCADFLGVDPARIAQSDDLRQALPREFMHDLGNTLQAAAISRMPERLLRTRLDREATKAFDVIAHVADHGAVCEFVPAEGADNESVDAGMLLRTMNARLSRGTFDRMLAAAARQVRAVTGYDRVMVYKFRPDATGVVVAESLRSDLEPYLGLHYPASDIPPQARELYRRQPLRMIVDVDYDPVPVLARDGAAPPLDLSLSHLRSVSPIHLEYLRNMGSRATLTLSLSLMRGDALWGLISCHHDRPRRLSAAACAAMELFSQIFSLQLEAREQASELAEVGRAHAILDRLRAARAETSITDAIAAVHGELAQVLAHDGLAVWVDGKATLFGATPPLEIVSDLARHVTERGTDAIFATSRLGADLPQALGSAEAASGMLAIPLGRNRPDCLLLFRKEQIQTVTWGGDPHKSVEVGTDGRISPRRSFAAWQETVRGQSLPWTRADLHIAEALQVRFLEHMLSHARFVDDIRRATVQSQDLLVAELNHRVKNIFALIRSLVRQSRAGARSPDDYARDLEQRIASLAIAHDQATEAGWRPASLRRLVEEQARTWSDQGKGRVAISGPPLSLDTRALQALALVLHEMMTNAAKYGALSTPAGRVAITWDLEGTDLVLRWRESGGPPVRPPRAKGFGAVVIEQVIPFELRGAAVLRYEPGGLEADFRIPGTCVRPMEEREEKEAISPPRPAADLSGAQVLVVEDNMMVALEAQSALESAGASVEIVGNVADALRAIRANTITVALLDVNLYGETSEVLADELANRNVPYIFATGYGERAHFPDRHRHAPRVSKPYDRAAIMRAVVEAGAVRG